MTPQERLDYLLADVWVPNSTLVTIGMLRDSIGLTAEQYGLVRGTLDSAISTLKASADPVERVQGMDLSDALQGMLGSTGISLSGETRQATIDLLATFGQWPDSVRDAIKDLGGTWRKQWQVEGYATEPTIESVTLEITKQQLADQAADAYQAFREALSAWNGSGDAPVLGGG